MSAAEHAPLRVLIHGARGRMGQALLRLCAEAPQHWQPVAAVSRRKPEQRVIDAVPHFSAAELDAVPTFDVMIDASLPEALDSALALAVRRGACLVTGTTGLGDAQQAMLDDAARRIPLLWASNFSQGVVLLEQLVRQAAQAVRSWDCDIVESHHAGKRDAPSGTALTLAAAAEAAGTRPRHASLRAGDIVGDHVVQFTGLGERIELIHRATDRDVFARGALRAAQWLADKPAGRYGMREVLGI